MENSYRASFGNHPPSHHLHPRESAPKIWGSDGLSSEFDIIRKYGQIINPNAQPTRTNPDGLTDDDDLVVKDSRKMDKENELSD